MACCAMEGDRIRYPITSDPMEMPKEQEAPRDVAVGAFQVLLHNGAFFQNEQDLSIEALAFTIEWTRHWKGQVEFRGWRHDGPRLGLRLQQAHRPDRARRACRTACSRSASASSARSSSIYNGQVRADVAERDAFGGAQRVQLRHALPGATSRPTGPPPGAFHEIERYILLGTSPHPFADHPNVEPGEKIFYVLREKNGTRYVFNCRGQLIYILSRNDSPARPMRVELRYGGELESADAEPDAQRRSSTRPDTASRSQTFPIHDGTVFTNIKCQRVTGRYPIPRIKSITGVGFWVEYTYRGADSEPVLEATTILHADVDQKREYKYDGGNRLTEVEAARRVREGRDRQAVPRQHL